MNAIATTKHAGGALVTADQAAAIRTALQTSLYPGASDASVDMVLAYCTAAGLDPMMKPVHIVPMQVSTGRKDERGYEIKEKRDVVMPGIGLYRTNAARTNLYAGCSEPEFGPIQTLKYQREVWGDGPNGRRTKSTVEAELQYPEWCRVTVRKLVGSTVVEFTAKEYWLENYATKSNDSAAPNAMWEKRPFAQLAKCTEAQGLRKAFPEAVGSQPTAEEMEGRVIEVEATPVPRTEQRQIERQPELPPYPADDFKANLPKWGDVIASGRKSAADIIAMVSSKGTLTEEQKAQIFDFQPPADAEFTDVGGQEAVA